jgi:cell division transport system permease protein
MKISNIHLRTAISNIRRSPFQAVAAVFVLSLTFFVITSLSVLVYSSNKVLYYFETRPQIIAFLKDGIQSDQISNLQEKLVNDARVKDVNYVSKEDALGIYKEATADNPLLSELVSPSIFPASLEFSVKELSYANDVINEIKQNPIVDQVGFTASLGPENTLQDTVERLKNIVFYLKLGGGAFVLVLSASSFLVLLVIISMRLTTRREEIEILDLVGATRGFIKSPIMIEAVIYTFLGTLLGWLVSIILTLYFSPALISYFKEIPILPISTLKLFGLFGLIFAGEFIVGISLALAGSQLAVARAKKAK